jgi:hypothetical protein
MIMNGLRNRSSLGDLKMSGFQERTLVADREIDSIQFAIASVIAKTRRFEGVSSNKLLGVAENYS